MLRLIVEILLLSLVYQAGSLLVNFLNWNVPPAFIGMGLLFLLLHTGFVKLSVFERSSEFLNRHVILFLLPLLVGVINYGSVLLVHGVEFITIVAGSTILSLVVTAWSIKGFFERGKADE